MMMVGRVGLTLALVGLVPNNLYLEYWFLWTALADVQALKRDTLPMENTLRTLAEQLSSK